MEGVGGISSVVVKCSDIRRNARGEGALLEHYWHYKAKARGAKGIRYPVVLAVNDEYSESEKRIFFGSQANALSIPPGEYARKCETQRNWRGPTQAVEHVV